MTRIGKAAAAALIIILIMFGAIASRKSGGKNGLAEAKFTEAEQDARYPYKRLEPREKALYRALYQGIANYKETIRLPHTYTDKEYERVYLMLTMQEPQFFYVDKIYGLSDEMNTATIYYLFDKEQAKSAQEQIDAETEKILSKISPAQSEAQKLMLLHDLIAERCRYSDFLFSDTVYGCLVNGMALCEGYAKTFVYLARKLGLEAMCVPGKSSRDVLHVWNIAKIEGKYYNIDVTWDDDDSYQGGIAHCCFAMPDMLFEDHIPDESAFVPPPCVGTEYTYYTMYGFLLTEPSQLSSRLLTWSQQKSGQLLEFQCASELIYTDVRDVLQMDPSVASALQQTGTHNGAHIMMDSNRQIAVMLPNKH